MRYFTEELTDCDRERLTKAAGRLDNFGSSTYPPSVKRYNFYRRKGHDRTASLRFALAWCRNSLEQSDRRLSHETGAENWLMVGWYANTRG
jgi:hypothetical protein